MWWTVGQHISEDLIHQVPLMCCPTLVCVLWTAIPRIIIIIQFFNKFTIILLTLINYVTNFMMQDIKRLQDGHSFHFTTVYCCCYIIMHLLLNLMSQCTYSELLNNKFQVLNKMQRNMLLHYNEDHGLNILKLLPIKTQGLTDHNKCFISCGSFLAFLHLVLVLGQAVWALNPCYSCTKQN